MDRTVQYNPSNTAKPRLSSVLTVYRAQNNGRSTDNVRPDRGLDRSNSRLVGHFDRSFLDACRLMRFAL